MFKSSRKNKGAAEEKEEEGAGGWGEEKDPSRTRFDKFGEPPERAPLLNRYASDSLAPLSQREKATAKAKSGRVKRPPLHRSNSSSIVSAADTVEAWLNRWTR